MDRSDADATDETPATDATGDVPARDTTGDPEDDGSSDATRSDGLVVDVPGTDEPLDPASADALTCVCEAREVLDLLSARHAIAIVCTVGALQPARYGQIEDALGDASSSTLSTRLEDLVDADVLAREQYDEIPPRVEYELTDDGEALYAALGPLVEWVQDRRR